MFLTPWIASCQRRLSFPVRSRRTKTARRSRRKRLPAAAQVERLEDRTLLSTVYSSGDVPKAIPDQGQVVSTINVSDTFTIGDVNVQLDVSHSRDQDLDVYLIAPDGTRVELFTDVGGGGNDFSGTTLDDEAAGSIVDGSAPFTGTYRPEGSLAALDGKSVQGDWTLEVTDDKRRETGTLNSWSITVESAQPAISINDVQLVEGDVGTTGLVFTVTRTGDTSGVSTVDWATADGTALAGSDYVGASGTLQFLGGDAAKTISVQVNGDTAEELNETFVVNLSNTVNATIADAQGEGTILNDDGQVFPSDPEFPIQWSFHNTGQTGGTYDADLDMPAAWSVTTGSTSTVVAVLGTGVEYTHADLYLNMYLNQDEIPAALASVLTDTDSDGLITFRDLNDPANMSLVSDLNGTGFIDGGDLLADPSWEDGLDNDGNGFTDDLVGWDFVDNDNDPLPAGGTGGHETGIAKFIGAMANNGVGTAGINWQIQMMPVRTGLQAIGGTFEGVAGLNYAVSEGAPISENAWGNGTFDQAMYDAIDAARLNDHLFIAAAGNAGTDNDGASPLYPASYDLDNIISVAGLDENDRLTTNFGLTSVDLAASWGATSGASARTAGVAALVHSLHPDWSYSQIKDRILSTVSPVPSLAGKTVTGGRLNAAAAVAESSIHVSNPSIVEGDAGATDLVFTVTRRGDVSQGLTLDWATADGTATAASGDYVASANTLIFLPGESSQAITVSVIGDALDEGDETLFVELTNPSNGLLADAAAQGTILNDDVQISVDDVSVVEGDHSLHFMGAFVQAGSGGLGSANSMTFGPDGNLYAVSLNGVSNNSVLRFDGTTGEFMDVFVTPGSGGLGSPRDLVFQNGDLYVTSFGNDEVLRFDGTTGAFIDVFVQQGSGGLIDPDGLTFGADGNLYVVGNGSNNVLRYDGTTGTFIDEFVSAGSGGLSNPFRLTFGPDGNLYMGSAGTAEILRFDGTTGAFIDDFVSAGSGGIGETHTLIFRDGYLYVTTTAIDAVPRFDATTGAFIDEYIPSGSNGLQNPRGMVFDANGNLLVENSLDFEIHRYGTRPEAVFTVTLSNPSSLPMSVDFATADGTAIAGSDYTAISGTITFDPGVTTRTILVPTLDDAVEESAETFVVNLSNAVGGNIADSQGVATIIDDDAPLPTPTIDSLSDSPDPVKQGQTLTLTATVTGTLDSVSFYRDSNGNGTLEVGSDELLGIDTAGGDGWSVSVGIPGNFPTGTYTYFAQGTFDGVSLTNVAITTGDVTKRGGGPKKLVAASAGSGTSGSLTAAEVEPLLGAALSYWEAAGADAANFGALDVRVVDLAGTTLGMASTSGSIWIDRDAAGWGWAVGTAAGRMDLLTVLTHELGHVLGLDHIGDSGVMAPTLSPGTAFHLGCGDSGSTGTPLSHGSSGTDFGSSLLFMESVRAQDHSENSRVETEGLRSDLIGATAVSREVEPPGSPALTTNGSEDSDGGDSSANGSDSNDTFMKPIDDDPATVDRLFADRETLFDDLLPTLPQSD